MEPRTADSAAEPWYRGVSRYEWLVLAIASAGWIFDAYEGQIFNITREQLLTEIAGATATAEDIRKYGDWFLGIFLLGGTLGGLMFGSLADRWGRRPTLVLTMLAYSLFTGATYFADSLWQVAVLRFLVALGVGGEWAVAAALVAEVFPARARAQASGLFHSTGVIGTWLAALAGLAVGVNWRIAYLLGVLPALLTLWVRARVVEPPSWSRAEAAARGGGPKLGNYRELLLSPKWQARALLGMLLAAVGLGTFWGVTVAGQDLARLSDPRHARRLRRLLSRALSHAPACHRQRLLLQRRPLAGRRRAGRLREPEGHSRNRSAPGRRDPRLDLPAGVRDRLLHAGDQGSAAAGLIDPATQDRSRFR